MNVKRKSSRFAMWRQLLAEQVNPAALRLLFQRQAGPEIRAALDWEKEHRQ